MPTHITRDEILRKVIHLSSIIYPLIYYYLLNKKEMVILTGSICFFMLAIELLRFNFIVFNNVFYQYLHHTLRHKEKNSFTGASYFTASIFLTVSVFEKNIAIVALYILIISDTCAAIIGLTVGHHKIYGNKTLEGFLSFLVSSILISIISETAMHLSLTGLILASLFISFVELFSKCFKIDDNLLIPLIFAMTYSIYFKIYH